MTRDTLFDDWAPPTRKDENSTAAAEAITALAGDQRRRVAQFIADRGPVAEWEVAEGLGLSRPTSTPRIWELRKAGVISRVEVKGRTPSGRSCWRYVIVPFWRSYLLEMDNG